jgi:hypothetical protein
VSQFSIYIYLYIHFVHFIKYCYIRIFYIFHTRIITIIYLLSFSNWYLWESLLKSYQEFSSLEIKGVVDGIHSLLINPFFSFQFLGKIMFQREVTHVDLKFPILLPLGLQEQTSTLSLLLLLFSLSLLQNCTYIKNNNQIISSAIHSLIFTWGSTSVIEFSLRHSTTVMLCPPTIFLLVKIFFSLYYKAHTIFLINSP